jgi:hypothetical protein
VDVYTFADARPASLAAALSGDERTEFEELFAKACRGLPSA